jgi:hypothetical protein
MRFAIVMLAISAPATAAPRPAAKLISDAGVGAITVKTAPADMAKLFPGVATEHDEGEDHSFDTFTIADGKHTALIGTVDNYVDEKIFFKVEVFGGDYATAEEISTASTGAELAAAYPDVTCKYETYTPNAEDKTRALLCVTPRYKHLTFYFDDKGWHGKHRTVKISKLAAKKVSSILWLPKSQVGGL